MRLLRRDLCTAAASEIGAVAGIGALSQARPPREEVGWNFDRGPAENAKA